MLNVADFSYHCLFNPLRNIETTIYVLNLNKDYWSASFPSRCVSPHKFQCVSSGKYVLSGEDPCSFNPSHDAHRIGVFFCSRTWFHDRKTDGTWPMPKKLIKGSKCLRSTSRWDHLASWRSPAVCRWAKCLGCCRSDMEDGERWGQNGKTCGKDFGKDLSQGC